MSRVKLNLLLSNIIDSFCARNRDVSLAISFYMSDVELKFITQKIVILHK